MDQSALQTLLKEGKLGAGPDQIAAEIQQRTGWWLAAFVALFTHDRQRLLMVQLGDYAKSRDGKYPWTLPGGSVEPGETPIAAVLRELLEETRFAPATPLVAAAYLCRPYFQSHRSSQRGELIVLYAGYCDESAAQGPPQQPEVRQIELVSYHYQNLLAGDASRSLEEVFPLHWIHWAECARQRLAGQLAAPVLHQYVEAAAMKLPIPGLSDGE